MPHRTTYFFPRQFPDASSSSKSKTFGIGSSENEVISCIAKNCPECESNFSVRKRDENEVVTGGKVHGKQLQNQLGDLVKWATGREMKGRSSRDYHVRRVQYQDVDEEEEDDDERERLLVPRRSESNDHRLRRLSSCGSTSYAGSLFSSTTLDGNWSSTTTAIGFEPVEEKSETKEDEIVADGLAQRCTERYYLQLTLAKRLSEQATLASEPDQCSSRISTVDADAVSYRLWV